MPALEHTVSLPRRYRATRRIAAGGMATVHAAEDTLLGRLVAVKVLGPGYASDDSAQRRFQREARASARVSDHPHVVTIYDIGEHEGQAFIVMEYLAGGTVAQRLRTGTPVPRPTVVRWLTEAASALDYAHQTGIVHRDVKPGNMLLDAHGRLAVGDFGIARMASDSGLTLTGQVMGTAAYLSPEQAMGRSATPASDRYALAAVAFEMLAGRKPFPAEHMAAQARAHVESEPPAASAVSPGLPAAVDGVLQRGLAKEPGDRWPTAGAMVDALGQALGEEAEPTAATAPVAVPAPVPVPEPAPVAVAAAAPPPPPTEPSAPIDLPSRRRPLWAGLTLAVVALIVGVAVAATTGGSSSAPSRNAAAPAKHRAHPKTTSTASQRPATPTTATSPPQTTSSSSSAPGSTSGASHSDLEAEGHALLEQGNVSGAIDVLRQAVAGCPVTTTDPCAYAMYDLGHALVLAGRPSEAIPVLEQRLQNPNQADTVQALLDRARAAASGGTSSPDTSQGGDQPSGPGNGNGHGHGHGKAKGHDKGHGPKDGGD